MVHVMAVRGGVHRKVQTHLSHQRGLTKVTKDTTIPIPTQTQEAMGTSVRIPPGHQMHKWMIMLSKKLMYPCVMLHCIIDGLTMVFELKNLHKTVLLCVLIFARSNLHSFENFSYLLNFLCVNFVFGLIGVHPLPNA